MYEDGRSDNHTSEINKTPESKVNTPDLIRKSGEEATENTPSQTKTTKRVLHLNRVTLQTMRPTKGMNQGKILTVTLKYFLMKLRRAMVEMRMKMSTHMLPRITRQGHMIKLSQISNDYDDTTLSRKDQSKDSSRCYSRHVKSESDYETVRSSQLQSSVMDDEDEDDFDSDFDDISESNYAYLHEFLDEVEYWNGEWAKSFQALQRMFHPKTKV